jgi:hypothetical protein
MLMNYPQDTYSGLCKPRGAEKLQDRQSTLRDHRPGSKAFLPAESPLRPWMRHWRIPTDVLAVVPAAIPRRTSCRGKIDWNVRIRCGRAHVREVSDLLLDETGSRDANSFANNYRKPESR